jgi:hypothetical protein
MLSLLKDMIRLTIFSEKIIKNKSDFLRSNRIKRAKEFNCNKFMDEECDSETPNHENFQMEIILKELSNLFGIPDSNSINELEQMIKDLNEEIENFSEEE